jgi:hypothetical protein
MVPTDGPDPSLTKEAHYKQRRKEHETFPLSLPACRGIVKLETLPSPFELSHLSLMCFPCFSNAIIHYLSSLRLRQRFAVPNHFFNY